MLMLLQHGKSAAIAASYGRILGANERIRIGGIGTDGRGEYLLGNVKHLETGDTVAVCDVCEPHRARVRSRLAADAREYVDHREERLTKLRRCAAATAMPTASSAILWLSTIYWRRTRTRGPA